MERRKFGATGSLKTSAARGGGASAFFHFEGRVAGVARLEAENLERALKGLAREGPSGTRCLSPKPSVPDAEKPRNDERVGGAGRKQGWQPLCVQ